MLQMVVTDMGHCSAKKTNTKLNTDNLSLQCDMGSQLKTTKMSISSFSPSVAFNMAAGPFLLTFLCKTEDTTVTSQRHHLAS